MAVRMTFKGAEEMTVVLRRVAKGLSLVEMKENLRQGAELIRARAAQLAPRGPTAPHMADHIITQLDDRGLAVFVGPEQEFFYAKFHEFGTIKMWGSPFLRPAFDTEQTRALTVIAKATAITISNVIGGGGML